jgi:hypothetical protein
MRQEEGLKFCLDTKTNKAFPLLLHSNTLVASNVQLNWSMKFAMEFFIPYCRNPTLAKCGGEAQHLEKLGFGVLRDSRMFRARQKGAKHLALGFFWCHWKGLEM